MTKICWGPAPLIFWLNLSLGYLWHLENKIPYFSLALPLEARHRSIHEREWIRYGANPNRTIKLLS